MKKQFSLIITAVAVCMALGIFTSCKDYGDDLTNLGERVVSLEAMDINKLKSDVQQLQQLVELIENRDYITSVVQNDDGSYTINFKIQPPITVKNGENGDSGTPCNLGIGKDEGNGQYYWTVDGQWLLDSNGNRVPASGVKGADGQDAESITPRVMIGANGNWWIWDETVGNYLDSGFSANGKNGTPDYIVSVIVDEANGKVTIVTSDGGSYTFSYLMNA